MRFKLLTPTWIYIHKNLNYCIWSNIQVFSFFHYEYKYIICQVLTYELLSITSTSELKRNSIKYSSNSCTLEVEWMMFVKLYVNFVIPTCLRLFSEWCDTTVCNRRVLNKTGTCFFQSGTFSSRRHPINLGINSHACASMAMLTEWQLPCHFRFVPCGEGMHAVCRLADLPELAQ